MSIVVVDDEPVLLDLIVETLEDHGYRALGFVHPGPVIELRDGEDQPNLFLIDILLPDMDGIALAARLDERGFARTPKIAMSATPHMLRAAQDSGRFRAILDKPFDLTRLLDSIRRCLRGGPNASTPAGRPVA